MLYEIEVTGTRPGRRVFVVDADIGFNSPEYALDVFEREGGVLVHEEVEVQAVDSLDELSVFAPR